jgi:hypothetical protein
MKNPIDGNILYICRASCKEPSASSGDGFVILTYIPDERKSTYNILFIPDKNMWKAKSLLVALTLCFFTTLVVAQKNKSFKTITVGASQDTTFNKIIDFLQAKDIFIQSVDKQAGFVQGKIFLKQTKMLSTKAGERRTFNFILRPEGDKTKIMLNIYMEQFNFGGDLSTRSYYYEDKGVMDDSAVYQDILSALQIAIDR